MVKACTMVAQLIASVRPPDVVTPSGAAPPAITTQMLRPVPIRATIAQ